MREKLGKSYHSVNFSVGFIHRSFGDECDIRHEGEKAGVSGSNWHFNNCCFTYWIRKLVTLYGGKSDDIFYLIIAQFLGGFASYSIMPLAYTLAADFLSDNLRPKAVVMLNSSG